ncbi:MAG: response regulator [Chitinophagaceae bacterium]|nr:response regulator [Chitinophagaceae bacterium]
MSSRTRIMIADDDPAILDSLSLLLEFEGYQVTTSSNGSELAEMKGNLPDLVILDIWMSGTDGRDICRALRTKEVTRNLPVIMMSASSDIGSSALEAGASDFLPKPFEIDKLIKKINEVLNSTSNSGEEGKFLS